MMTRTKRLFNLSLYGHFRNFTSFSAQAEMNLLKEGTKTIVLESIAAAKEAEAELSGARTEYALTGVQRQHHSSALNDYTVSETHDSMIRKFRFKDQKVSIAFSNFVKEKAAAIEHDEVSIKVEGNTVTLELYTSDVDGLSMKDVRLARQIQELLVGRDLPM